MVLESRRIRVAGPIERLPPELLLLIFLQIDDRDEDDDWQDVISGKTWPVVLLVSKYWHDVACSAPTLWQDIHVHTEPDWLKVSLHRSGTAFVDVTLRNRGGYASSIPILLEHTNRIRMLAMVDSERRAFFLVKKLLLADLPNLQELRLIGENYLRDRSYLKFNSKMGSWPSLRVLRLTHLDLTLNFDPTLFSRLRVLDLAHMQDGSRMAMPLDWALTVLETCSQLEELRLHDVIPELEGNSERFVSLPHLRRLEVFSKLGPSTQWPFLASALVSSGILLRVHLPLHASLKFVSEVKPDTPVGYRSFIPPDDPSCVPILRHATAAHVRPNSFVCSEPGGGTLEVAVKFDMGDDGDAPPMFHQDAQLLDVVHLLARAPLTRLALVSESLHPRSMAAAFRAFLALTTLEFSALPAPAPAPARTNTARDGTRKDDWRVLGLCSALMISHEAHLGGASADESEAEWMARLPLRSLRVLSLNGLPREGGSTLSHITGCLGGRYGRGAPNLAELSIAMYEREGAEAEGVAEREERETTIEMLGMLVDGPVVYRDCEPPRVPSSPAAGD